MTSITLGTAEDTYYKFIFDLFADRDIQIDEETSTKVVSASKIKELFLISKVESKILKVIWSLWVKDK